MVDIEGFWQSFKCSWIRRLLSTESFWPSILQLELSRYNTNLNELLFLGPSKLLELSKCVENKFWSNVLISVSTLQKEASYSIPENFYMFPIWNNPLFKNGRRVLYSSNFSKGSHKIQQVADFYSSPGVLLSLQQINRKFRTNIKATQLTKIHNAIGSALVNLNFNLGKADWHDQPRQSLVIQIATKHKKGCRPFYNVFRARKNERSDTTKSEDKWHEQLDNILSVDFWNDTLKLNASINNNNFAKWLQYQIVRNSIFTNNRVSKFKSNVSEKCDLCSLSTENAFHLFYQCHLVQQFWVQVKLYLLDFDHYLPVTRLPILFGIHDQDYNSVLNTIILLGKRVIWTCKKNKNPPKLSHFKNSLLDYLKILKVSQVLQNSSLVFEAQWGIILFSLQNQDVPCSQLPDPNEP